MRIIIGLLILGSLFLMAALWQQRITDGYNQERRLRHGMPASQDMRGEGWARLVLGRPSGEPSLQVPEDLTPMTPPPGEAQPSAPPPEYPPDYEYVVSAGDVLGRICQAHYDSAHPLVQVVDAVAAYNDLRANNIREGQVLLLPDLGILFPGGGSARQ